MFHQWKALTTSLLSTMSPHITGREETAMDIVDELEDLLETFQSRLPKLAFRQVLQSIVYNAIALDETFCGQQNWYRLHYPSYQEKRYDYYMDESMATAAGSSLGRMVRFVIRPALYRDEGIPSLVPPLVWT
jgi:hypothetical protein